MKIISSRKWEQLTATVTMSQKTIETLEIQTKALQQRNLTNSFSYFFNQIFPQWLSYKEMKAYETMDDIYAVVSRLATTAAMIPFKGVDKAGKDLPEADGLQDFIDMLDFEKREILYTYLYLYGEGFLYKVKPEGGVNAGTIRDVYFLHPMKMILKLSSTFPEYLVGYKYMDPDRGISEEMDLEDVIHLKLYNPSYSLIDQWRGLSPVKVLCERLTRMRANLSVSTAQMQNGGIPGIVYDKTQDLSPEVIGSRRDNFNRYLQNQNNKGAPYFSAGEMGYIPLGLPLADMDVAALAEMDFKKVCNVYSISDLLFNNGDGSTFSNYSEAKKLMYSNAVLPNVMRVRDVLNKQAVPEIKTKGKLKEDISGISELQDDMTKKMQAYAAAPVMIPNDVLEAMGKDRVADPEMDKPYIKTGYTSLEEMTMPIEDVADDAGDYNNVVNMAASNISRAAGK